MGRLSQKKKGFTLVEVVVSLVMIAVGVLAIIGTIQYSTRVMTITRSQVIATNLAREGVEMMFNKRDTNWQMYPSKKDKCWLVNANDPTSNACETLPWMKDILSVPSTDSNLYWQLSTLSPVVDPAFWKNGFNPKTDPGSNSLIAAELCNVNGEWNIGGDKTTSFHIIKAENGYDTFRETTNATTSVTNFFANNTKFYPSPLSWQTYANKIGYTGPTPSPLPSPLVPDPYIGYSKTLKITYERNGIQTTASFPEYYGIINPVDIKNGFIGSCNKKYGSFFRYIYIDGLYNKLTNQKITCENGASTTTACGDSTPKELRFCSIVDYALDSNRRRVQLCTAMTNFKQ